MNSLIFSSGALTAAAWLLINYSLTIKLFQAVLLQRQKNKLSAFLLIKFPLLYLLGFLILSSRVFPFSSIFSGLSLALLIIGAKILWPTRK